MAATLIPPDEDQPPDWRQAQQTYGLLMGETGWGVPISLTSADEDGDYSVTIENQGTGGHLNVPGQLQVTGSGATISNLIVAGGLTTSALTVNGDSTMNGDLDVSGLATIANLSVLDNTATGSLGVSGTTTLGDANADTVTVIGVTTFRNAANTLTQLFVDAGNNRVIVGSATALGSDTTPCLQVAGRLYVGPDSANDLALQVRRSAAATVGFSLGVTSTNDFVFKDDSDTETFRVGDTASTYQAKVTGKLNSTSQVVVSANGVDVTGPSVFRNAVSVTSGGFDATGGIIANSGGLDVTGDTTLDNCFVNASGASSSEKLRVVGISRLEDLVQLAGTGTVFSVIGSSQTQTTVGAAGGASALPATPRFYLKVDVGATACVIPLYNA